MWTQTRHLIEVERTDPNDRGLLFVTKKGIPVSQYDAIGKAFTKLRNGCQVTATFSQLRDTSATMIERIAERTGNETITSMILAHSDKRTAKWYAAKDPRLIDSSALDAALDEIEREYNLPPAY